MMPLCLLEKGAGAAVGGAAASAARAKIHGGQRIRA
jgi:hypothetical protein